MLGIPLGSGRARPGPADGKSIHDHRPGLAKTATVPVSSRFMKLPHYLGLIALMGVVMIWRGLSQWRQGSSSREWPEVSGKVTQSYLRKKDRKHSLTYTYTVGGESFTGQRKQFGQSFNRIVNDFAGLKEGDPVTLRHRPDAPAVCTLKAGAHPNVFFFLLGGLVFAAGAGIAWSRTRTPTGPPASSGSR